MEGLMEGNSEEENEEEERTFHKEDSQFLAVRSEDGQGEVTSAGDPSMTSSKVALPDVLAHSFIRVAVQDENDSSVSLSEIQGGVSDPRRYSPCFSPLMDTCDPSVSSLSSSSSFNYYYTTVSSSPSCLSPPLPPSVELSAVLTDTKLTLDVYQGGAAALPQLWGSIPDQMRDLQYLRLGSEDKPGLDGALDVLPHLRELRSLAVRGHCFYNSQGDPLPGLLTTLPASVSSLSHLVHLDLSFNQLSCLPACLLCLPVLSTLLLCHNKLSALPPEIGRMSSLTHLSFLGNELVSLPPSLGELKALQMLDVSHNLLRELPDEIGSLGELTTLELAHNRLKQLPESMGSLLSLRELVIFSNDLRIIPHCLNKLPLLKIDVRDNPLGQPPTPPPLPPTPEKTKIPELHLMFNQHSFCVSSGGCHVFLPGGAELLFPPGCLLTTTRLKWAVTRPNRKCVQLEDHEILLSHPLELQPHGVTFLKPVEVCIPYHRRKKREVVLRTFDGKSWCNLPTDLRRGSESNTSHPRGRPAKLACCSVSHFSWFMAVSRPVVDSCSLTPAGALLVSRSDPGVKLHFPKDSTAGARTITLQVLQVSVSEVQALCGDPQARVSHLLFLSQTPSSDFLQPVKVQVPLPSGVNDPTAQTWSDITSQVSLYVTHLYAIFYITHFSWYWLWYTTHRCVSGVIRKVYQRLKQFKVQFVVLQRKADPSQVLVQCLPANKIDSRVQSLAEQYEGPQPSDLCDLLEGEQFFAGFERGLDIVTDSPDCVGGRLCFVFYSSLKNLKEVYICPAKGHKGPVRGQVSFYRGEIPSVLPEEVVKKRKGLDSQWLATLPLRLPALNSENNFIMEETEYPPLNLGDPESGYLTEANLLSLSLQIGHDWRVIGINLGLSYQELDRIQHKNRDNLGALVLDMLFQWARRQNNAGPGAVSRLMDAMVESSRRDLADEIEDIVNIGRRKYSESLRRVGLEGEGASAGEKQQ
ncbi:p53-induced death domain-containing protein 1 isoform 2-T2 [Pholidichthys leucotaenia]